MTRLYNPPTPHRCRLVALTHGGPKDLNPGAVEKCDECGAVWVYDPVPWERVYRSLRPWPFDRRLRRALRALAGGE